MKKLDDKWKNLWGAIRTNRTADKQATIDSPGYVEKMKNAYGNYLGFAGAITGAISGGTIAAAAAPAAAVAVAVGGVASIGISVGYSIGKYAGGWYGQRKANSEKAWKE
jgi:hypothetical protein